MVFKNYIFHFFYHTISIFYLEIKKYIREAEWVTLHAINLASFVPLPPAHNEMRRG